CVFFVASSPWAASASGSASDGWLARASSMQAGSRRHLPKRRGLLESRLISHPQPMLCEAAVRFVLHLAGGPLLPAVPNFFPSPAEPLRSGFFHRRFQAIAGLAVPWTMRFLAAWIGAARRAHAPPSRSRRNAAPSAIARSATAAIDTASRKLCVAPG